MRDLGTELYHLVSIVARLLQMSLITVAVALLSKGVASAGPVEIQTILPQGAAPSQVQLRLVETVSSPGDPAPEPRIAELAVPGSLRLDLEPGSIWHLALISENFWAAPEIFSVDADPTLVKLSLWSTARVRGRIQVGQGESLPEKLTLRFESPPNAKSKIKRASQTCTLIEKHFECIVPATSLDLRLRAEGFVSHYFWGVALEPRSVHDLGATKLERGASVVGWVELADPKESFEDVELELSREIANADLDQTASERRPSLALTASVNDRGFYELTGVSEGLYAVTATHPNFAPARYSPVRVLQHAETELPTLELDYGVALQLILRPERAPAQDPWKIHLLRHGEAPGHLEQFASGTADPQGIWTRTGLPPDDYFIRIRDSSDSTWYSEELPLPAGSEHVSHQIDLPAEDLVGQVFLGSEPVAARLFFGGYHGSVRIPAESGEDGRFEVAVPQRELWTIDVYTKVEDARQRFEDVAPKPEGEDGQRSLKLVIPDTLVEGRVVDADGEPVENARVNMSGTSGGMTQRSRVDGSFQLRGLRPGDYWLKAETLRPLRRSEIHRVKLDVENGVEPIELVVRGLRQLDGQVIGPSGQPVIGAKVVALVEQTVARPIATMVPEATTDLSGVFSLELPQLATTVQLTVFPPGFAASQLRVDARSPEPTILRVEPAGGTLRIHYDEGFNLGRLKVFRAFLLPFHPFLINWAHLNGVDNAEPNVLSVPMLEPGPYAVCRDLDMHVRMSGRRVPGPDSRCAEGLLAPFAVLDLKIPE